MKDCSIEGTNFKAANLRGAILTTEFPPNTFRPELFDQALVDLQIYKFLFSLKNGSQVVLPVVLREVQHQYTKIDSITLVSQDLTKANLISCDISNSDLRGTILHKGSFFLKKKILFFFHS